MSQIAVPPPKQFQGEGEFFAVGASVYFGDQLLVAAYNAQGHKDPDDYTNEEWEVDARYEAEPAYVMACGNEFKDEEEAAFVASQLQFAREAQAEISKLRQALLDLTVHDMDCPVRPEDKRLHPPGAARGQAPPPSRRGPLQPL